MQATWAGLGDLHGVFDAWQRYGAVHRQPPRHPARDPPRRDPAVRGARGRVGGRGEAAAGADPVGRQARRHGDRSAAGATSTPDSRSRRRTSPRTGSSSRSSPREPFPAEGDQHDRAPSCETPPRRTATSSPRPSAGRCNGRSRPAARRSRTATRSSTPSPASAGALAASPAAADPLTPKAQAWIAEFSQALRPYVNGAYVNVPNIGMADWETAYWGSQRRPAAQDQGEVRPAQRLPVRAEHPARDRTDRQFRCSTGEPVEPKKATGCSCLRSDPYTVCADTVGDGRRVVLPSDAFSPSRYRSNQRATTSLNGRSAARPNQGPRPIVLLGSTPRASRPE